ncbi:MAG: hypothetical protein H6Q26_664 [Bacteroidetes bacterium]|uniref:hypothetical protein n=1 Tax=unclassified Chitinophaga TaxID=2619133 RepID=UPI0009CEE6F7|nr:MULTISPECIES: hypothetical protein [unclassified Chitinophaga]MBP1650507.1 hypothetical protein [Bacteroidota bacterium]OMP79710.1 hypothetical protein BW716_08305 [[Flexibacter] sp. ATCC 35208]WPV66609.1 hypothetical protein QQL36_32970 [Chitinophaga sp. LS1]
MKLSHAISYCSLLLALGTSCNRNIAPQERFQSSPIDPDGNASEWTMPLRYANSQYTLSYSITNDSRNIYICVMTSDPEMKHRIMKAGMSLYFDPKGKQKKKMALVYPERNMDGIKVPTVYNTDGFLNMENGQHNLTDKMTGIKIGLNPMADSGLVYEAAIPLNRVLANGLSEKALRKSFSVGVMVNQLPGKRGGPGEGQGQGQRRGGGGGSPRVSFGGGMGMGGMGSGMGMGVGMGMGGMRGGMGGGRGGAQQVEEDVTWTTFRFSAEEKK